MEYYSTEICPKCEMTEMRIYHDFIRGTIQRYLEFSHCENCEYENTEEKETELEK